MDTMSLEIPTFQVVSFDFEGHDVPEHVEAYPSIPCYVGQFSVFGAIDGTKHYPLAINVQELSVAELLCAARARKQESTFDHYGYTDDVYIHFPDGRTKRYYYGRSE